MTAPSQLTQLGQLATQTQKNFIPNGTGAVARTFQSKAQDFVNVNDFGVVGNGTTDDTAALQAAINYCVSVGKALIGDGSKTALVSSTITIPPNLTAFFQGMTITPASTFTSGYVVTVSGGVPAISNIGQIHGLTITQPFVSGHANTSLNLDGMSLGQCSKMVFYGLQIQGFRDNLAFNGPNCYLNRFENCFITTCWRRSVAVYSTTNSGENHVFVGCTIANANNTSFNGVGFWLDPTASGNDVRFIGTSFDYCDISIVMAQSYVNCTSCHFENNNNNPHVQISVTSSKERPNFNMIGGSLGGGGGVTSWTGISVENATGRPAYVTTTGGQASIYILGTKVGSYNTTDQVTEVVQQTDGNVNRRVFIDPILDAGNGNIGSASIPVPLGYFRNTLYIPASLTGWTINNSSGTTWSYSTTQVFAPDTGARQLVGTSGSNTSIAQAFAARVGQRVIYKAYIWVSSISSGYVCLRVNFIAQDGVTTVSTNVSNTVTAVTASWVPVWFISEVPNGTATVSFQNYANGFTGTAYWSNEHAWIT